MPNFIFGAYAAYAEQVGRNELANCAGCVMADWG